MYCLFKVYVTYNHTIKLSISPKSRYMHIYWRSTVYVILCRAGLQGHLWTETVRTREQFDAMIFPRMLAMAERAWHKALWEDLSACGDNCDALKAEDWTDFANTLGYKELGRLSELGINYYVPPPGAR